MDEKTKQQVREAVADHEASRPYWRQERRDREIKEAQDAEARAQRAVQARHQAQQQVAANNTQAWCAWVDQRIVATIDADREALHDALGQVIAEERRSRQKEIKAAVDEVKQWVSAKFEASERRIEQHLERHTDQCNHVIVVSAERTETLGKMIETERTDRQKEVKAAVEEAQRAVEVKLAGSEQRIVQHTNQRIVGRDGKDADPETVARFVGERIEEPLHEFIRAQVDTKLAPLEQRLKAVAQAEQQANNQRWATIDQRVKHIELEMDGRLGPSALHQTQCTVESKLESKLEALGRRLKSVPGKLPVAKTWHPDSVTYQSEFISHNGALYQARTDTATAPGGDDWICVARAGRDAITPEVRGTYSVCEHYKTLDIVAMDGASFIATRDAPGVCPGIGWQLLCKQGKRGRPGRDGERGAAGPQGTKGLPAIVPQMVSSKIDENYNLVILRSDDSLEIIPLREAFERYHTEVNR